VTPAREYAAATAWSAAHLLAAIPQHLILATRIAWSWWLLDNRHPDRLGRAIIDAGGRGPLLRDPEFRAWLTGRTSRAHSAAAHLGAHVWGKP
jgi:hypothetical protein